LPSNITAFVSGKSSLARLGLQVHAAALIHPGSRGHVVLEIFNHNNVPIILRKGMAIAQLVFFENNEPIEDYAERKGLYLNQKRIELPREISFFVQ
ncbi:MAG: dCTP deaminase, partial [Thermoprotei archaeon]